MEKQFPTYWFKDLSFCPNLLCVWKNPRESSPIVLACSYMIKLDNIYDTRKNVPNVQMYLICKTSTEFSEQSVEVVELYAEGVVTCKRW